jgi:hypothetical protein
MSKQYDLAKKEVEKVRAAFDAARDAWSGAGRSAASWFGFEDNTQKQVLTAINSMAASVNKMLKKAETIPDTDQEGWNSWTKIIQETVNNLHEIANDGKKTTITAITADAVKESAKEVKVVAKETVKTTKKAIEAIPTVMKYALPIAGIVLVLYLVLVAKRVAP